MRWAEVVSPTLNGSGNGHWDDASDPQEYASSVVSIVRYPANDAEPAGRAYVSPDSMTGAARWHVFGGPANGTVTFGVWYAG